MSKTNKPKNLEDLKDFVKDHAEQNVFNNTPSNPLDSYTQKRSMIEQSLQPNESGFFGGPNAKSSQQLYEEHQAKIAAEIGFSGLSKDTEIMILLLLVIVMFCLFIMKGKLDKYQIKIIKGKV